MRNNVTKIANEFGGYTAIDEYLYSANSGSLGAESYAQDNLVSRYKIAGTSTRTIRGRFETTEKSKVLNSLNSLEISLILLKL